MKVFRSSGRTINPAHIDELNESIKKNYDKIEKKLGKATPKNVKQYQKALEKAHKDDAQKYPISIDIDCPTKESELKELCVKYGSVAFCIEDDELALYILDQ
jgi:hypothetical protein